VIVCAWKRFGRSLGTGVTTEVAAAPPRGFYLGGTLRLCLGAFVVLIHK
jgi:hypothetical protein